MVTFDLSRISDHLGQLPFLRTYSHLALLFPLHEDTAREIIIADLEAAVDKITKAFPWLLARVVTNPDGTTHLQPRPSSTVLPSIPLVNKDCSTLCPSYDEMMAAGGPVWMFDGNVLGPKPSFPVNYVDSDADPAVVFVMQANFLRGGLLLDFAVQHQFIDANGRFQIMRLFAAVLRGEGIPADAIEEGNRDRRSIVPLLGPEEPMIDHSDMIRPATSLAKPAGGVAAPREPARWVLYRFETAALGELKQLASQHLDDDIPYISSNDAASAHCWQQVTRARLAVAPELGADSTATSKFARAMDSRRVMGISQAYMGDMVHVTTSRLPMAELESGHLGRAASALRRSLNAKNNAYAVRSWATFIDRTEDRTLLTYRGEFDLDRDMGASSLAGGDVYQHVFGRLGKPTLVRRPTFGPLEANMYFWPQPSDGSFEVLLCFGDSVLDALEKNSDWSRYARRIG